MPERENLLPRTQALQFNQKYGKILVKLDANGPPTPDATREFCDEVRREIAPFIAFKEACHKAQASGAMSSLVWPGFFDHTRREAERWSNRLEEIAAGRVRLHRREVVGFWGDIMADHAVVLAQLLGPTGASHAGPSARSGFSTRKAPVGVQSQPALECAHPHVSCIPMLEPRVPDRFASQAMMVVRPLMAEHVRREAVWFIDELRRACDL